MYIHVSYSKQKYSHMYIQLLRLVQDENPAHSVLVVVSPFLNKVDKMYT